MLILTIIVIAKAAKKEKKEKKQKDPNAPKKPLSAFFFYIKGRRDNLKKENPALGNTDIVKVSNLQKI